MPSGGFRPNSGRKKLGRGVGVGVRLTAALVEQMDAARAIRKETRTDYISRAIEIRQAVEAGDLARARALLPKP